MDFTGYLEDCLHMSDFYEHARSESAQQIGFNSRMRAWVEWVAMPTFLPSVLHARPRKGEMSLRTESARRSTVGYPGTGAGLEGKPDAQRGSQEASGVACSLR